MNLTLLAGMMILFLIYSSLASAALNNHPDLLAAHQSVQAAIKSLAAAKNGKQEFGHHRYDAEQLLNKALTEIQLASDFADKNPSK